ncbi:hypothetical protein VMCG_02942 [Cytospora schulzeri]|uniref:Uncharacterized protein n=1 Tax=Cytospora schulzeri TaxID=448051 RepID=A0A423WZM5_9PEZI|nr:hypothetical protein VMCG_02942 [Valsa malicola]
MASVGGKVELRGRVGDSKGFVVEPPFEDPEEAPEVVDADDEVGVAYTLAEPSLPPAPYVADADSENDDDHTLDDASVEVEMLELDVELDVELENGLDDALSLVESELVPEDGSVVPKEDNDDDNDDWNNVALATHVG